MTEHDRIEVSVIHENYTEHWQMKLGRNDPCSCGSGKKYKQCCLNAGSVPATAPGDLTWRRQRALVDGYATQMLRFTAEAYGPLAVDEAWNEFMCDDDLEFDPDTPLMPLFMHGSSIAGRLILLPPWLGRSLCTT